MILNGGMRRQMSNMTAIVSDFVFVSVLMQRLQIPQMLGSGWFQDQDIRIPQTRVLMITEEAKVFLSTELMHHGSLLIS